MNKRGQGLSVNAIILIVLGLIVLAALIFGFTTGFGGLKDIVAPSNNVATIVSACQTACALNSAYDYCTFPRELKAKDVKEGDIDKEAVTGTCNAFSHEDNAENVGKYGVEKCTTISCPSGSITTLAFK